MQGKLDGKSCPVLPCPIGCFRRIGQCIGRRKSQVSEKIFRSIKQIKVPDFLQNQELFGGDYWTRTSDLLRVKIRQGRKERAIPSFPPLLAQNDLLSAPLFPLFPAWSNSSLGQGLGQSGNQALFSRMTWQYCFKSGISLVMISQVVSGSTEP